MLELNLSPYIGGWFVVHSLHFYNWAFQIRAIEVWIDQESKIPTVFGNLI